MPLEKVGNGYRWGKKGKIYKGKNAKKLALKQGFAENKGNEASFKAEMTASKYLEDYELLELRNWFNSSPPTILDNLIEAYIPQKERDAMPISDFAWPEERKYPIKDQAHLDSAVKLLGRAPAEKQASIKRKIISIGKRKGLKLPESWS